MNRFDYQKQAVSSSRRLQRLDSAAWTVQPPLEQSLCGDHGHPAQTSRRSHSGHPQLAGQQVGEQHPQNDLEQGHVEGVADVAGAAEVALIGVRPKASR